MHYYPIISSARAFGALWKRAYHKTATLLGGVVPRGPVARRRPRRPVQRVRIQEKPEDPYPRVVSLRKTMNEFGLGETPIIMANNVWWLENGPTGSTTSEIGPIAFQFGTRPLLTKESPIPEPWKQKLADPAGGQNLPRRLLSHRFLFQRGRQCLPLHELEGTHWSVRSPTPPGPLVEEHTAEYGVEPRRRITI